MNPPTLPPSTAEADAHWMRLALAQARAAAAMGEVPVGAVLVGPQGQWLASGHNQPLGTHDPTAHAEIQALRAAARQLGNYRLDGCTLYVTLEPCAMCASALLQARLARVVYGAAEPKTGAAGSALNLFAHPGLNHHTQVQGGLLADECAALLQAFFKPRRANPSPLRPDALRPPEARFANLADYPWPAHYCSQLPALDGLRLHYLDVPPAPTAVPGQGALLCLHDWGQWSYAFTHTARAASQAGWRVLAPDLIGFGKSDKPKKPGWHSLAQHRQVVEQWLAGLAPGIKALACCGLGWGQTLAQSLRLPSLPNLSIAPCPPPPEWPQWLAADAAAHANPRHPAWAAPFADAGHRAALRLPPPQA